MALGTPVAAAVAYSASGGATVTPTYPTGIAAGDAILLIIGQKPSTANSGSVTTPTGWTLVDSLTGAGGYGTTLGADTGNTNLRIYAKDTVTGTETGNLLVSLATNNVTWAFMVHIPVGTGSATYGSADGQRTTAPTAGTPFTVALTNGTTPTNFQAGDLAIWAMCIPSDVTTPNQFSASSVTATGATFGTAVEFNEPDSATGNDIGGYSAYASVTAGSSTTAPSVTVTAAGTVTNVRGPIVMVRVREVGAAAQTLTPSLYTNTNSFFSPTVTRGAVNLTPARYDNTNVFYSATVTPGAITLTPARYDNTNVFYSPTVTQSGGVQTLLPALYTNTNSFFAQTITAANTISPALYTNTNVFYSPTITATRELLPALYTNTNSFYTQIVTSTALISPQLFTNTNEFFSPIVAQGNTLFPALYENQNVFYQPTVSAAFTILPDRYDNTNVFYSPSITTGTTISPDLYVNTNTFYQVSTTYGILTQPYVEPGYVDDWYVGLNLQNVSQFFSPTVTIQSMSSGNMFLLFFP